jgi:hypothetical protein
LRKLRLSFHKLIHWEYWPEWAVFSVPMVYYFYLSFRARSFFFFNATDPGIKNGGYAMEPKHEIYDIQPAEFTPVTLFVQAGSSLELILKAISDKGLTFPLIAKPDIGLKGMAVARVNNKDELNAYVDKAKFDFLIQELITYPNEIGVFYYRYPDAPKGTISGIVQKEFLTVTGDGRSAIAQLISHDPRHLMQIEALTAQYGDRMNSIPSQGEILDLVPFGNHVRGAKFIDASHLITQQLIDTFDSFCTKIPGFYYGRLDIRYDSFEELERGEHFSIIELNGAGAGPTHIFDPAHSIFFAWGEIIRHWRVMYEISIINHKKGHRYLTLSEGIAMLKANTAHIRLLEAFSK